MKTPLHINTDKPRINLLEQREVTAAALAANPTTEAELDATLASIRATGKLLGKCYADETAWVRPRLLDVLVVPRLTATASHMRRA